jgi:transcriptional regulator with XRE-family HTH domain
VAVYQAEDERIGALLKAIRRRSGETQLDIARRAHVPKRTVVLIETRRAGEIRIDRVRSVFEAAGARLRTTVWWNGALADRLLDERHAAIVDRAVELLTRRGWQTIVEASFSEWGERGSIDILGGHAPTRAIVVGEVKASLGSLEETNRILDAKERLAPKLALQRFGWQPASVARLLIVPRDSTVRRVIQRHAATMQAVYPARGPEVRSWLRRPDGTIRGIWIVSDGRDTTIVHRRPP